MFPYFGGEKMQIQRDLVEFGFLEESSFTESLEVEFRVLQVLVESALSH